MKSIFKKIKTIAATVFNFIKKITIPIFNFFKKKWVYIPIIIILVIGLIILSYYFIWCLPIYIAGNNEDSIIKHRATNAQIVGGIVFLFGLYIALRRAKAMEKHAKAVSDQAKSSRETLVVEQYFKAVEQFSDPSLAIRLGGIYSLEKIMNSDDNYHDVIIELFCAYIRENRPFDFEKYENDKKLKENSDDNEKILDKYNLKVDTDIQAILTVLGRRINRDKEKIKIDLRNSNLYNYNLSEAHLENAELSFTNFGNANLSEAHLENAVLFNAHLEDANLLKVHLENAELFKAHLEYANLRVAHLENADLFGSNLENAILVKVNLKNAGLIGTNLKHSDLRGAYLKNAHLIYTDLRNSNLSDADIENADLIGVKLENADLRNAFIKNNKLSQGNIKETKEDIINFIKELEKAEDVEGIQLDSRIMKIIEDEFPALFKRIKGEED